MFAASARPLPASNATITPPISPGPAVAATASTSRIDERRFVQHPLDQARQDFDMGARRDFRHHAAIRLVRAILPDDGLSKDSPVAGDQRRGAVVARKFEA